MKKLLFILPLILSSPALVSCSHENQQVALNFDLANKNSTIGNSKGIELTVFDDRSNKNILGKKNFSGDEIEITADKDLAEFLKQKILANLTKRGFKKGSDKIIEIHIETLSYKAKQGLPIGESKITSSLKLVVHDSKSGVNFTKIYDTNWDSKHFIAPLKSTDSETINLLLRDAVQEILSDDSFLESLVK